MPSVGAIILAAGGSERLGRPKQLVIFQGESLARRAVRAVIAQCSCVAVVVGDLGAEIENNLRASSATIVPNAEWRSGIGTSIRCGLRYLLGSLPDLDAVVILACDQPYVEASTIAALIVEHERSGKPIVASRYANTLGIPALFDRSCFDALLALPDQSGAKAIIESRPDDVASIEFEKGAIDIDTPADFERLR
ncbi:MAG: molybdenum cofactor cytidylyltransferase [Verrucomicrobiota bacterium]|jgi:molybdenum cofactor cytidylyltransferase